MLQPQVLQDNGIPHLCNGITYVNFFVTYRTFLQFFPLQVTLKRKVFNLEYCYISEFSLNFILYILC